MSAYGRLVVNKYTGVKGVFHSYEKSGSGASVAVVELKDGSVTMWRLSHFGFECPIMADTKNRSTYIPTTFEIDKERANMLQHMADIDAEKANINKQGLSSIDKKAINDATKFANIGPILHVPKIEPDQVDLLNDKIREAIEDVILEPYKHDSMSFRWEPFSKKNNPADKESVEDKNTATGNTGYFSNICLPAGWSMPYFRAKVSPSDTKSKKSEFELAIKESIEQSKEKLEKNESPFKNFFDCGLEFLDLLRGRTVIINKTKEAFYEQFLLCIHDKLSFELRTTNAPIFGVEKVVLDFKKTIKESIRLYKNKPIGSDEEESE